MVALQEHCWFLCKAIFMRFMFAKFKKEIIDYLMNKQGPLTRFQNIVQLAQHNRLDLCETVYLETNVFNGIESIIDHASLKGNLEIVKYLTAMGASCSYSAMDFASRKGNLEVVKWLH